jgi:uncharacterized protein (DUF58 family)
MSTVHTSAHKRSGLGRRIGQRLTGRRRSVNQTPPITLSRRRLYILPTRSGAFFALVLLIMLAGATNYANSLAFALTFWLVAIALVSMHRAHRNLVGLNVVRIRSRPVFAGGVACFDVTFKNEARRPRRALRVTISGRGQHEPVDVITGSTVHITFRRAATIRGFLPCPVLQVESRYPLGLFRVWSRIVPRAEALVYPRPAGCAQLPEGADSARAGIAAARRGGDEFFAHRRYRPGDAPRHIDWKASARSEVLMVREYAAGRAPARWFDYHSLSGLTVEARLSQLALWVERAAGANRTYGLRLPGLALGPDHGELHRRACLKALALF